MRSYHAFALKEIKAQRITSALILIAIILSTMMTTVIGQSIGILDAMRRQQAAFLNGNRYATFHDLTKKQADSLINDSRLSYAEKMLAIGLSYIPNSNMRIGLREYKGAALSAYESISRLESGRLPENAGEIALPQDVLTMLGYQGEIGDTITLDADISLKLDTDVSYSFSYDFVLTGILKTNYMGYVNGWTSGIVGTGTAEMLLPEKYMLYAVDIRVADKRAFQNTVDDLAKELSIAEDFIQYNDTMLVALGIDYLGRDGMDIAPGVSFVAVSGVLIGILVLLAAGLVIYNILKIAVTKRIKQYGTLRAIGAKRGKLYALVTLQLAILCGIGIPIGMIFGVLSTGGITTAATSMLSPEIFMASSQNEIAALIAENSGGKVIPLLISAAITLLFAFVAAMPAARYAAKVSPVISMTGQAINIKRGNRKTGRIRNFEAFYAGMNMKRNRGRTVITLLSLVMSVTVFIALQSFTGLLDASASIRQMHLGDYSVTNEVTGFSPDAVRELRAATGVSALPTLKHKSFMVDENGIRADVDTSLPLQPYEALHIAGVNEERLLSLLPSVSEQDLYELKTGAACLVKNPIPISFGDENVSSTEIKTGDIITVNGLSLRAAGLADQPVMLDGAGFINGVQIIVYDTVFDEITGQRNYTELYPILSHNADREAVEQTITSLCEQAGGSRWLSYQNTDRQLEESYEQTKLLAWGLISFIGLIGILNIINTVYTNIHTRIAEIGVQRAIGMSAGSLFKTFLWEGAYYGIIAAVIGNIAGYICAVIIGAAVTDTVKWVAVPLASVILITVISVIACLTATCIPLKKVADMSIVESIGTVE